MTSGWLGIIRGVFYPAVAYGSDQLIHLATTSGWFTAAGVLVITGFVGWLDHVLTGTQTSGMIAGTK